MKRLLATVCATLWVLPSALYAQGLGASQLILTNGSGGGVILQPDSTAPPPLQPLLITPPPEAGHRLVYTPAGWMLNRLVKWTNAAAPVLGNSLISDDGTTVEIGGNGSVTGNLAVAGNTTLGDAAGDTVRVNARTVELPNIPSGSTATEVLVWKSSDSTVERRAASGLISGFAWMLTGNSITSAWNGSSGNFLGTTNARPLVIATTDTTTPQPIQFWTRNVERMRITEAGEVVVQNRAPNGATKVIIQAGANQGTENLLEWRDNSGDTLGVIDANGLVGIGTPRPVRRLHVEGNGSVSAVFVNGGVGIGTVNPLATLHVYDEGLTGATQVVIQSGANQLGVDLLQWRNNSGDTLGVIRPEGSVVLFYDPPARQAFFAVADPSGVPLIGIGPDPTGWGVGVYDDLTGQLRAGMGKVGTQWRMGVGDVGAQNGVLLNWETTNTDNEPRIVVANGSLATPVFLVDREGDVTVAGNTTLGDAAGDTVRVNARTVELPNIPSGSTATEVLVWKSSDSTVERRAASGLISGFAWMLTGNSITSAWNGSSGNFLGTTNARPLVIATTDTTTPQPIQFWTRNVERMRITEAGEVVVQNQAPNGATKVIIQAGANQGTENLLEWRDNSGDTLGVIDANGLVGIGTTAPVRRLHVVGNGTVSAVFVEGGVGVGTVNPLATLHVYDEGLTGATQVIIQAGANQGTVNLLEWQDSTGTILGVIDADGRVGIGTSSPAATLHIYDERTDPGTGATQVIIQAGANQGTVNLLEWRNNSGDTLGVIDANGLVGIGTTAPVRRLHVVGNGSVSAVFVEGGVGVGTVNPLATLHVYDEGLTGATQVIIQAGANQGTVNLLEWQDSTGTILGVIDADGRVGIGTSSPAATLHIYDERTDPGTGVTQVIIQAGANQGTVNLLEWSDTTGNVLGRIDYAGNLFVNTNTTLGDAAGDTVRVNARTVELPNIPSGSTATEVLVWKSSDSTVERRAASGLISGFAWMLTGNSITSAWNGSSGNFLGTTNARPLVIATTDTTTPQPIQFWTRNVERMRITEAGEVVVQNQAPNGATKVIIQAGANQGTENLLEWRDNSGDTLGVIDANGLVGIGTTAPVRRLHVVGNGTVSAVFVEGGVGVGTVNPLATLHVYDEGLTGATQVIIQAGANQGTVNLLEWQDSTGTILGVIDADGRVGIGTSSPAATLHIYDERTDPGTGATQVIIQAGANQGTVNLLEWRNNSGDTLGVIDANGLVGIGTTAPVRRLHVVGNGSVSAVFVEGGVGVGTVNPLATLHVYDEGLTGATQVIIQAGANQGTVNLLEWQDSTGTILGVIDADGRVGIGTSSPAATLHIYDERTDPGTGVTQVIIQAGANQGTVNLLEWSDTTGNVLGRIDYAGNLFVNTNTTLGDAAGDTVRVNARTVELPNIPSGSTATEVLVWKSSDSTVERRAASGLISGFAWMLTGNSITSAWNGSSGNFLGTTNARPLVIATTDTTTPQPIQFWTRNVERMRITEAGEVVVQNQAPNGATKVIIQAGANQGTENLLEWRDNSGDTLGVIDANGLVGIGTTAPVRRLHVVGNGTVSAVFVEGGVGVGTVNPLATLHVYDEGLTGATQVIIQAGANQGTVNLLEWQDSTGTILGVIDADGRVGIGTSSPAATLHIYDERTDPGTGATQVIIQAGANQGTVNLLEWRNNSGDTLGVIDANGLVGIGTTAPVRRLHVVGNGSVSAVFVEGGVGVGTVNPLATLHVYDEGLTGATQVIIQAGANQGTVNLLEWQDSTGTILGVIDADGRVGIGTSSPAATLHIYDERTDPGTGVTQVIIQAGANQGTVNLLEWSDTTGNVLGRIDYAGNLFVNTNTTLGDAAGDTVRVNARTVELPNIPSGSTATEVLVWKSSDSTVERRAASGLISGFAWMLTGNSITSAWNGSSGNFLGTTNARPLVIATTDTTTPQPIQFWTRNVERMRITEAGEVVVQNQAPNGATKVIIQAGANQGTENLLEWRDNSGDTLGVIDANGLVGIGTTAPVRRLHVVGNGTVSAVFVEGGVGVGTVNPLATLHVYDEGLTGATQVIIQAGANQGTVNLLEWQDSTGTILGVIDADGRVGIGTSSPAATLHIYDERTDPGTGATQVIIQAGANQGTVNLLEWRNNSGDTLGVIDANGLVGIGTTAPVRRLHVVGNGSVSAVFVEGGVGVGTVNPLATLHVYDEGLTGATQVIIQAGANQGTVNLLEWQDSTGTILGVIDADGRVGHWDELAGGDAPYLR
jgi:hypothetical protein